MSDDKLFKRVRGSVAEELVELAVDKTVGEKVFHRIIKEAGSYLTEKTM